MVGSQGARRQAALSLRRALKRPGFEYVFGQGGRRWLAHCLFVDPCVWGSHACRCAYRAAADDVAAPAVPHSLHCSFCLDKGDAMLGTLLTVAKPFAPDFIAIHARWPCAKWKNGLQNVLQVVFF